MNNSQVETLLKSLMDIDSTSGNETMVLSYIEEMLKQEEFIIKRIPVTDRTYCILATIGTPKMLLQAHTDTVAPYIPFSENNDTIFGRGACDTKGCIASMLTAAIEAKQQGLTDFGLLFTVEEETTFHGATEAGKVFNDPRPYVIVGEPTSLQPVTNHYGVETYTITAKVKQLTQACQKRE